MSLNKLAIERVAKLVEEAQAGVRNISFDKNIPLSELDITRTDTKMYKEIYASLCEAERWLSELKGK